MRSTTYYIFIGCLFASYFITAQTSLQQLLDQHTKNSIPFISVEEVAQKTDHFILLDAREEKEFEISHLKNAIHVGYDHFIIDTITKKKFSKDSPIVVYCSLGIRSERIAEKLKKQGYKNIFNLYGGIFEWKNKNFPVVNKHEQETDSIHVFSKEWGKWLLKGKKKH
ncbi:rhodanese-like domain-containing protein [Aquimarina hainanensis]|uniref:Rhodanese-like domain-containing protein n=1 Tax=Aquimarina hainanensis TaxID=1578017 RepID=A0ABW5N4T5_9FLAO